MLKLSLERAPFVVTTFGVSSALVSLMLAWKLLQFNGNPAFLLIWLIAAAAMAAYIRFHRRWLKTFQRLRDMDVNGPAASGLRRRSHMVVEDVAFIELPDTRA